MVKIYTRLVMDIETGETLEAECYDYEGPVAQCMGGGSGGGSSTTNTVDYAYNARMATLSEEQQAWAREYFKLWQDYQKPYEIAQAKANLAMLPLETDLYKKQLTAATELLPQQAEASKKIMTAALDGVDVNERMALATADTANAWKDVQATTARANARLGVNPNSGRFQGIAAALDTQKAAQLAGARTQARVGAEQENFDRLMKAATLNAQNGILQGISFTKG
ncbi:MULTISPECIES: hypothetical protein [unclassified Desulfovibrio]|uniref:hypothetical protein n=1 Tax=unclassified Desulfovibrio TaxID=2593640 RepID=UPI0013EC9FA8|nr:MULTISPECIES: hypothetical protein [unclassified Desulfovibrio]